jgi:hypothetical protein
MHANRNFLKIASLYDCSLSAMEKNNNMNTNISVLRKIRVIIKSHYSMRNTYLKSVAKWQVKKGLNKANQTQ